MDKYKKNPLKNLNIQIEEVIVCSIILNVILKSNIRKFKNFTILEKIFFLLFPPNLIFSSLKGL